MDEPKHYGLDTNKGFPFAINEISNLYNGGQFAAAAFLLWGQPGFDPFYAYKHYIITGCVDNGAGVVSAGWVMMGGTIAQVSASSYTGAAPGIKLTVVNPEAILWSDAQSRNSVYGYRGVVAEYTGGDPDQIALTDFERLTANADMTLTSDWSELVNPNNRGGIKIRLFHGFVEISGTVEFTGATTSAANLKICDLPSWAIPPNGWGGLTTNLTGGKMYNMNVTTAGALQLSGELSNSDKVVLDNLRWSILSQ